MIFLLEPTFLILNKRLLINIGLWDQGADCVPVYPATTSSWMSETACTNPGVCIMTSEPISTQYIVNTSHQSVSLCGYPLVIVEQQVGGSCTAAHNSKSNSKLPYDRRSDGQSLMVSGHHLGPANNISFSSIAITFRQLRGNYYEGPSLTRE
jgi:hypothetical protein